MAKKFQRIFREHLKTFQRRLEVPDCAAEKLSSWTYTDMKREFQRSMELFYENGFVDDCIVMAYKCAALSLRCFMYGDKERTYTMTENAMAITIYANEALKSRKSKDIEWLKRLYEEHISTYRNAPTHGLILSAEEQSELDRDIDSVLTRLVGESSQADTAQCEVLDCEESDIDFGTTSRAPLRVAVPAAESDGKLRERLSERAYEMLTEYERADKIIDSDILESQYLAPNGLKMTDELREFIELYDGRVYAWQNTIFLNMNVPFSCNNFDGFSILLEVDAPIFVSGDKYFINTMDFHVSGDWGPYVGSDGKIYEYCCGELELPAKSPEEFFEEEARKYFKDMLLIERRRELENKYLIPEIRTASM